MINAVGTADALRLAGVDRKSWQNTVDRGFYTVAPKGRPRLFAADDLVALAIFRQLVAIRVIPEAAATVASAVREILRRRKSIEFVYLIAGTDERGKPRAKVVEAVKPGDDELHKFRVQVYREQAQKDIAAVHADQSEDE